MPSQDIWTKCFKDMVNQQMFAKSWKYEMYLFAIYLYLYINIYFKDNHLWVHNSVCWQFGQSSADRFFWSPHGWSQSTGRAWWSLVAQQYLIHTPGGWSWLSASLLSPCGPSFSRRLAWTSCPQYIIYLQVCVLFSDGNFGLWTLTTSHVEACPFG